MNLKKFIMKFWKRDSIRKVSWVEEYLNTGDKVLDLGAGPCYVTSELKKKGFEVTALDIENYSNASDVIPMIFGGKKLPFKDNSFDVVLILTVLHHVGDYHSLIEEAKRVSKKIIIIEDIYNNILEKYLIYLFDSLFNLEFFGHPHNNLSDEGWNNCFKKVGLKVNKTKYQKIAFFCTQATYFLEKD